MSKGGTIDESVAAVLWCAILPDPLQESPGWKGRGRRGGGHVHRTERKHVNSYGMDTAM